MQRVQGWEEESAQDYCAEIDSEIDGINVVVSDDIHRIDKEWLAEVVALPMVCNEAADTLGQRVRMILDSRNEIKVDQIVRILISMGMVVSDPLTPEFFRSNLNDSMKFFKVAGDLLVRKAAYEDVEKIEAKLKEVQTAIAKASRTTKKGRKISRKS